MNTNGVYFEVDCDTGNFTIRIAQKAVVVPARHVIALCAAAYRACEQKNARHPEAVAYGRYQIVSALKEIRDAVRSDASIERVYNAVRSLEQVRTITAPVDCMDVLLANECLSEQFNAIQAIFSKL